jgi:gamma-glutamyl:cysteine ligase YbdK (ATP-grasp superfamily)
MGLEIDRSDFTDSDYRRFDERLRDSIEALRMVLLRPGFGDGETTVGVELELHLIDAEGRPAPVNRSVLGEAQDPRLTLELSRFNLEINSPPTRLAGSPFSVLAAELESALSDTRRAAESCGARLVAIGILPTLEEPDLTAEALTGWHRYLALSAGLRRIRREPFRLSIAGEDELEMLADEVTFEGANASFQIHLRVPPGRFADTYNAAQLAVAPVLAVAGNSPLFLGRRLWDETRIALFRQAVDDRQDALDDDWRPARVSFGHGFVRRGAWELFAEGATLHEPLLPVMGPEDPLAVVRAGRMPQLAELRLHQGTVWRWNRPVFDPVDGGHLRIEFRALPAGPTVADMMANAAFQLGLVLGLEERMVAILQGMTFTHARRNFYQAARRGPDAELLWPPEPGRRAVPFDTDRLVDRLLPVAERGLREHGVDGADVSRLLGIIADRAVSGRTGARVQRAILDRARDADPRKAAVHLVETYLANQLGGAPVHTWSSE